MFSRNVSETKEVAFWLSRTGCPGVFHRLVVFVLGYLAVHSSLIAVVLYVVYPPILGDHLGSGTVMGHALSGCEGVLWCRGEDGAGEHLTRLVP